MILRNGIEVGNIFKLGTKFTRTRSAATYLGEDGQATRSSWARTASASGATSACIVEAHHDDKGIVWPAEVAPYAAHLVSIGGAKEPRVVEIAERLHDLAAAAGPRHEILWDDRDESPGVKFTDAELLGMPWILTVSPRSLAAGGIEVTERATGERVDPPDRGGRGAPDRAPLSRAQDGPPSSSGSSATSAARTSPRPFRSSVVPSRAMTASASSAIPSTSAADETSSPVSASSLVVDPADGEGHAGRDRRRDRDLRDPVGRALLRGATRWSSPGGPSP